MEETGVTDLHHFGITIFPTLFLLFLPTRRPMAANTQGQTLMVKLSVLKISLPVSSTRLRISSPTPAFLSNEAGKQG